MRGSGSQMWDLWSPPTPLRCSVSEIKLLCCRCRSSGPEPLVYSVCTCKCTDTHTGVSRSMIKDVPLFKKQWKFQAIRVKDICGVPDFVLKSS